MRFQLGKEIAQRIGVVLDTFVDDQNRKYQWARFESMRQLQEAVDKGVNENIFDPLRIKSNGLDGSQDRSKWMFGTEFPTLNLTREAMIYGLSSENVIKQVSEIRDLILNIDEIKEIQYRARTKKKRKVYSESGSELDIDRVLCGDPQHWQSTTPGKEDNVIRIGFNMTISAAQNEKQFYRLCAYGIVLCELAEQAGYNVELNWFYISQHPSSTLERGGLVVKVKDATQPLDINQVCSCGIPGTLRAFGFGIISQVLDGRINAGLGQCKKLNDSGIKFLGMNAIINCEHSANEMELILNNLLK